MKIQFMMILLTFSEFVTEQLKVCQTTTDMQFSARRLRRILALIKYIPPQNSKRALPTINDMNY